MLRKYFLFITLGLAAFCSTHAQTTAEIGLFFGRSYYLGELNPTTHWGKGVGSITFGGVFKYNLNKRYTLKASIIRTNLTGADEEAPFEFNALRQAKFKNTLTEFAGTIEFNFLPYKMGDKRHPFTPYLFVGLSYYINDVTTEINGFDPAPIDNEGGGKLAMPFGPGLKVSLGRKWALAAEWGFRKTGYDLIDGLENRIDNTFETGKSYDNDWFVVTGFMLTFKLTDEGPCPVYNF